MLSLIKKIAFSILFVVVSVPAAGFSYLYLRKPAQAPALSIKVSTTPKKASYMEGGL